MRIPTVGGRVLPSTLLGKETSVGTLPNGSVFTCYDNSTGRVIGLVHWDAGKVYVWLNREQKKVALMKTAKVYIL